MQIPLGLAPSRKVYTVAALNAAIRGLLDENFSNVWVSGELSGVRLAPSGHYYFTLKDGDSQIRCACFRMSARYLKFKPQDGVAVLARGRVDVYEARGEYQLLVEALEPQGYGALQFAFEQLKKKLMAEGLFDAGRRRPLPKFPARIGIVTSPSGAVIQDILSVLTRRFPGLQIRLYPAQVQGEGSAEQVCRGIRYLSDSKWPDVILVARGGGSLEDLWTFNEEPVARAIVASQVPVVSAVGHETDYTIADFVADLRAPTPSAAAELVVCARQQVFEQIGHAVGRLEAVLQRFLGRRAQRLDEIERCLGSEMRKNVRLYASKVQVLSTKLHRFDPRLRLGEARRRLEALDHRAATAMRGRVSGGGNRLQRLESGLAQLSPLKVLDRGYAIVKTRDGKVLKDAEGVEPGTGLRIRLAKGELDATTNN